MKKNKAYQKPVVLDLGGRAASGQNIPDACMPGSTVATPGCATGEFAGACDTGSGGFVYPGQDCLSGSIPVSGYSCVAGGTAGFECAAGTTPSYAGDCTTGPSF